MHAISNPLSPGNGDLRGVLSGHFCASLHVGHARSIRPVFDYRITVVVGQIKNKIKTKIGIQDSGMALIIALKSHRRNLMRNFFSVI